MHTFTRQLVRCFFALVMLVNWVPLHANELNSYIVGGQVVSSDAQYPFMASIYRDTTGNGEYQPSCGGTLIADRYVLTAAHCLLNKDFNRLVSVDRMLVLIGTTDLAGDSGTTIEVNRVILHPDYDIVSDKNDIGIIELAAPINAPRVVLPAVGSAVPMIGESGLVLGWGATIEGGALSPRLREIDLPVINNVACFPFYTQIFDSRVAFCAGGSANGGQDSCQGDSGGPLLVIRDNTYVIAGIVSYGDGCARAGIPGVYTRVETFTNWINANTTNTIEYTDPQIALPVDNTAVTRLEVNSTVSGQLRAGQVAYFDVSGARQVNLTSTQGDADLYIINDKEFQDISAELVQCASREATALDICVIDDTANSYAVVHGFSDASYTISTQLVSGGENVALPFTTGAQSESDGQSGLGSVANHWLLIMLLMWSTRLISTVRYRT